jgi:hypothetical protein
MQKIIIWAEFKNILSTHEISNKADIKLTIQGSMKKVDLVSQLDLISGYEFEIDEHGEYCISLENTHVKYKENFILDPSIKDVEIAID